MRKFILPLFFFIGLLLFPFRIEAQQQNERWVCLDTTPCVKTTDEPKCTYSTEGGSWGRRWHATRVRTEADKPLPSAKTYIVECLAIPTNLKVPAAIMAKYGFNKTNNPIPTEVCTTGSSTVDRSIFRDDRYQLARDLFSGYNDVVRPGLPGYIWEGYYHNGLVEKFKTESAQHYIMSDAKGNLAIEPFFYVSHSYGLVVSRKIMALNFFTDPEDIDIGNNLSQKQGVMNFDFEAVSKDCAIIKWDPYGKVFDSETLEPIPGVSVLLDKKNDDGTYAQVTGLDVPGGNIENPQVVEEDGDFSFLVADGTYRLTPSINGYTFPNDPTKINGRATQAYSDIYRGEDIVQQGAMVHRDIPLDPLPGTDGHYPAKIMDIFVQQLSPGLLGISGSASHPLSTLKAYCKNVSTGTATGLIASVQTDRFGNFQFNFDQSLCRQGEGFGVINIDKYNFLGSSMKSVQHLNNFWSRIFGQPVAAATLIATSYRYNPVLNTVKGYAYDENGNVLANAKVEVYLLGGLSPYATATTDDEGYFALSSEDIPNMQYRLVYVAQDGQKVNATTTSFMKQNAEYIANKKINLYASDKVKINTTPRPQTSQAPGTFSGSGINRGDDAGVGNPAAQTSANASNFILIAIILLMLVMGGVVIAGVVLWKKKQGENVTPPTV